MMDIFGGGVDPVKLNESFKEAAINHFALVLALEKAGVVTYEQIAAARAQATSAVDQRWAELTEKADKQFAEEHPGAAWLAGVLREQKL